MKETCVICKKDLCHVQQNHLEKRPMSNAKETYFMCKRDPRYVYFFFNTLAVRQQKRKLNLGGFFAKETWSCSKGLFCGNIGHFCGDLGLFCGDVGRVHGDSGLFCGDSGLYCGDLGLLYGVLGLFHGDVGFFCRDLGLIVEDSGHFCGDSGVYSGNPMVCCMEI